MPAPDVALAAVSLRRALHYTQPQMAEAVGVSVATIRAWEQGRRHPSRSAFQVLAGLSRSAQEAARVRNAQEATRLRSPLKANPKPRGMREALSAVSPAVKRAAIRAHRALRDAGVPHVVVGGVAVGAHGHPRATKDIDFMTTDEAFVKRGVLIAGVREGLPFPAVDGIPVDYLGPTAGTGEAEMLEKVRHKRGLHAIPVRMLIRMKLYAGRVQDDADVVHLLNAGADATKIRRYVARVAPELVARFDALARRAAVER